MPAWLYRKHLPLIFNGWNSVEGDPPEDGGAGGGSGSGESGDGTPDYKAMYEGKQKALESSRLLEKELKRVKAILGDIAPDRLLELRDAETKAQQQSAEMERRILEAKNQAASDYQQQLKQAAEEKKAIEDEREQIRLSHDIFRAFGEAQGSSTEFEGFMTLASSLFHRTDAGLQVKDAAGKLITTKDDNGQIRAAKPAEFMTLLISGKLDGEYDIPSSNLLKMAFKPYNQARGAGLPNGNGAQPSKPISEMSQNELAQHAFKS